MAHKTIPVFAATISIAFTIASLHTQARANVQTSQSPSPESADLLLSLGFHQDISLTGLHTTPAQIEALKSDARHILSWDLLMNRAHTDPRLKGKRVLSGADSDVQAVLADIDREIDSAGMHLDPTVPLFFGDSTKIDDYLNYDFRDLRRWVQPYALPYVTVLGGKAHSYALNEPKMGPEPWNWSGPLKMMLSMANGAKAEQMRDLPRKVKAVLPVKAPSGSPTAENADVRLLTLGFPLRTDFVWLTGELPNKDRPSEKTRVDVFSVLDPSQAPGALGKKGTWLARKEFLSVLKEMLSKPRQMPRGS